MSGSTSMRNGLGIHYPPPPPPPPPPPQPPAQHHHGNFAARNAMNNSRNVWSRHLSSTNGRWYYWNKETGNSTYTEPAGWVDNEGVVDMEIDDDVSNAAEDKHEKNSDPPLSQPPATLERISLDQFLEERGLPNYRSHGLENTEVEALMDRLQESDRLSLFYQTMPSTSIFSTTVVGENQFLMEQHNNRMRQMKANSRLKDELAAVERRRESMMQCRETTRRMEALALAGTMMTTFRDKRASEKAEKEEKEARQREKDREKPPSQVKRHRSK